MEVQGVQLRRVGSFFVGGETKTLDGLPVEFRTMVLNGAPREVNPNGEHVFGQMYVQEFRLARPKFAEPVLLWHGGGMTGCTWETTPDGRAGWLWKFLQAGYDVLVSDAVERGRSSWAMYPQIYREAPVFRTKREAWLTFRIGPTYSTDPRSREAYPGQKFPVTSFDDFASQWVPRWPGHDSMILAAYDALVRRVGPCRIVAHSQGAGFASEIVRRHPSLVRSVVAVEPGGMAEPGPVGRLPAHLVVWGDHIEASGAHWTGYRRQAEAYLQSISDVGSVDILDLPRAGIPGNSHLPMMDTNSDQVFDLITDWLKQN